MAFSSSNWQTIWSGLSGNQGHAVHWAKSTDLPDVWNQRGHFAGCGANGRAGGRGARVGDLVFVQQTSGTSLSNTAGSTDSFPTFGAVFVGSVVGSSIDQSSTAASSAFSFSYDITVTGAPST